MEQRLGAAREPRAHRATAGRLVPVVRGRHGAGVRREADETGRAAEPLARELPDVELTRPSHLRRARIAEVGVVGPDAEPRLFAVALEMLDDRFQRLDHVRVAQVPRRRAAVEHRAVVALRVGDEACVLLGGEEVVVPARAAARRVLVGAVAQLRELPRDVVLAGFDERA